MQHAARGHVEQARASWLKRRVQVTSSFVECLGGKPDWVDLDARVRRRSESSEYVAEWVSFNAEPGEVITGLLVWPSDASAPVPVVLAHHGFYGNKELMVLGDDASGPGDGAVPRSPGGTRGNGRSRALIGLRNPLATAKRCGRTSSGPTGQRS